MNSQFGTDPMERASHVFYVSSHGTSGDHWFDWFAKGLNAHPEIMIYMGDTVRSKYLKERTRKERPDLMQFTQFLIDLGEAYTAIGECYAYRSYQLEQLQSSFGERIRFVNIIRHPYCWLESYVYWRTINMNMPMGNTDGIDHEWSVTCHDTFKTLGLTPYSRSDIEIWASYQGMDILNRMITDANEGVVNYRIEDIVQNRAVFNEIAHYLSHGRLHFDDALLDRIYRDVNTPWRKTGRVVDRPEVLYAAWPDWKKEAFNALLSDEVISMFEGFGYRF
ncbi:MAG: hypothetical protein HQL50_00440 [Magnetococcales bacterium]|nr:hypothetical protein [Magnetococcales bacterium]